MSDTSFQPGSSKNTGPAFAPDTFHPKLGTTTQIGQSIDPGDPVTIYAPAPDTQTARKSQANALATSTVNGFAVTPSEGDNAPALRYAGPLTLPAEEWDLKVDELPRVLNTPYYLDAGGAGIMTTTAPSTPGQFVTPLGFFSSDDTFQIQIGLPVAA